MSDFYDVCIIGGGASGMACAVNAAERGRKVCVIEKNPALGKKLYATGNGRCNITNMNCENAEDVLAFFRYLGLETITEGEGRVYPASGQAADVVFVLEKRLAHLRVDKMTGCPADWIAKCKDGFEISSGSRRIKCRKAVLACGGKAAPMYGTTGDGYALAQSMGHTVMKPVPVLTAIETQEDLSALKGVRAHALCRLLKRGKVMCEEAGEVQFADYGLSGICIFNLSRFLLLDEMTSFSDYEVELDLSSSDPDQLIRQRRNIPGFRIKDLLRTIVPQALATDIVRRAVSGKGSQDDLLDDPADKATDEMTEMIGNMLRHWRVRVKGAKGWKMAQCTKGGVALDEVDELTMESRITKGLYITGELLDHDGPCGGYNLQNAWETGMRAGRNV